MTIDVVGVGAAAYDYLCIIDRYPQEDGSANILEIHNQGGGCTATALVAAQRLGFSTAYIGNTGDNFGGRFIRFFIGGPLCQGTAYRDCAFQCDQTVFQR